MPPSRRSRRANNAPQAPSDADLKKGDIVEFELDGKTTTGRLVKRCPRPTDPSDPQLWLVAPSDRRRKNEKISELDLRRIDDEDDSGSGSKRKTSKSGSSTGGSKGSDDNAKSTSSTGSDDNSKKRKSSQVDDDSKKVTFKENAKKKKSTGGMRVGTRATRNSGHELFDGSEQVPKKKVVKKTKKNEHVTVVQMLTGTLYLYKGETRRAEFVRSKY